MKSALVLPACCSPFDAHWPLPEPVPGSVLLSTRFTPTALDADDFQRCGIPRPASIERSVAKRQTEFLAGRLCARAALWQLDGTEATPTIGDDRAPQWPAHTCGAITHSHGRAVAIVGHTQQWQGLGLDLENLLSLDRAQRLVKEILTPAEHQRLLREPDDSQAQLVTLTFSVKESLFKALYPLVQQRFYFEHAEVLNWTPEGKVRLRLLTDLSNEWHHGRELDAQFGVHDGQLLSLVAIKAPPL